MTAAAHRSLIRQTNPVPVGPASQGGLPSYHSLELVLPMPMLMLNANANAMNRTGGEKISVSIMHDSVEKHNASVSRMK